MDGIKPAVQKRLAKDKPKDTKDDLWPWVKEKIQKGLELRRPFEAKWILQIAFLAGKQYSFFNVSAHLLQQMAQTQGKRRRVDNQLLARWRRLVADLIKNNPKMSVVPNSHEDQDIQGAKLGHKAMENFWRSNGMRKKNKKLAEWIYATGNAFLDDRWNEKLGPVKLEKDGEVEYEGDADCGVWSPFDIVVPGVLLGDDDLHAFPWLGKMKWRDLDWIRGNYKKRGREVVEEVANAPMLQYGSLFGTAGGHDANTEEGAYVIDFYVKPCVKFPKGKFVTASNGVILQEGDYNFNQYHLEHFKDIDIPGVFWGKATLEDAIPLQVRWNITINNIDEFIRTMGKGKGLTPRGAKLSSLPDDTHGEWIEYTPIYGHKPEILTLKGLPNPYIMTLQTIQDSMDNLFSQHEVSRGTNKSDIRSGEMVALLQEQDSHGKIPSHQAYEESLERVMSRILKRIQEGYTTERMIKTVGTEGQFDVVSFKGTDLRNNTDVHVKTQSSLPDSRIARENIILQRMQAGLYGDIQRDPKKLRFVMNQLDDAVVEDFYSDTREDEALARVENKQLMNGAQLLVNDYDDHGVHFEIHNSDRKKIDYQKIKFVDPKKFVELEASFNLHQSGHLKAINEQRERMLREQAMMKGGGK